MCNSSTTTATSRSRPAIVCLVGLVCLVQTLIYSVPLPALPDYLLFRDDEHLRLSQGQLGVIMGMGTAVTVVIQPIIGRLLVASVTDKTMIALGLLINGSITALLALVDALTGRTQIYLFVIVLHALASVGHSMSSVAIYVSLGTHLSDINHIMLPLFDILFGVAMIAGPLVGGPLYRMAGIVAVYVTAGGLSLATALLIIVLYPSKRIAKEDAEKTAPSKATFSMLLRFPVMLNIVLIAHCYCMMMYNDVTLTNRLKTNIFNWPRDHSYAVFGVAGASFAILGLAFGLLAKRVPDTRIFVLLALPVGAAAWLCISTVFNRLVSIEWMYLGQFLLGFSMSPMFVCCYFFTLKYLGGDRDPAVYAIVSGVFNPSANLGGAAGQLISEFLQIPAERSWMPYVGPDAAMVAVNIGLTLVLAVAICCACRR